jgi:hypothetical protein
MLKLLVLMGVLAFPLFASGCTETTQAQPSSSAPPRSTLRLVNAKFAPDRPSRIEDYMLLVGILENRDSTSLRAVNVKVVVRRSNEVISTFDADPIFSDMTWREPTPVNPGMLGQVRLFVPMPDELKAVRDVPWYPVASNSAAGRENIRSFQPRGTNLTIETIWTPAILISLDVD